MTFQEVALDSIDLRDESFRISEELDSPQILASLREVGQLNPVVLLEKASRRIILCGFRRVAALRRKGSGVVWARVYLEEDYGPLKAFRVAIFDNLAHREFSPVEKARILHVLKETCGVAHDTLVAEYLPLLGLRPHQNVLRTYLGLHFLEPGLRRMFNDGRLTLASAERLSSIAHGEQLSFAHLLDRIRLSASRQRELLDIADELSAMRDARLEEIFTRPEIQSLLDDARFSPFQKGEKVYEVFYRWRNPRLSQAEERFQVGKMQLGLPGAVHISPDPYFETPRLRIEFCVSSPRHFREVAAALRDAGETPALDELFRVS